MVLVMPADSSIHEMPGRMPELVSYFQENREKFGNPRAKAANRTLDLIWHHEHQIALRWSWQEIVNLRLYPEDKGLILCALIGDYEFHLELKEKLNPCVYANYRLKRFPGSAPGSYPYPNRILKCLTREGEFLKNALNAGLNHLEELG
jgi:hypothetical protein